MQAFELQQMSNDRTKSLFYLKSAESDPGFVIVSLVQALVK